MSNKFSTLQLNNGSLATSSPEVTPRLLMIEYSLSKTGPSNVAVSSRNYSFQMVFPDIYEFETGKAFNKDYPQNETVGIGGIDKEEVSDLVYNVSIGFTNEKDLNQLVEMEIFNQKRNTNPSPLLTPAQIDLIDIKLEKTTLVINGSPAVRIRFRGAFDADGIVYYFVNEDNYYRVSVGRNHGKLFTASQLLEIDRVIKSFKFI